MNAPSSFSRFVAGLALVTGCQAATGEQVKEKPAIQESGPSGADSLDPQTLCVDCSRKIAVITSEIEGTLKNIATTARCTTRQNELGNKFTLRLHGRESLDAITRGMQKRGEIRPESLVCVEERGNIIEQRMARADEVKACMGDAMRNIEDDDVSDEDTEKSVDAGVGCIATYLPSAITQLHQDEAYKLRVQCERAPDTVMGQLEKSCLERLPKLRNDREKLKEVLGVVLTSYFDTIEKKAKEEARKKKELEKQEAKLKQQIAAREAAEQAERKAREKAREDFLRKVRAEIKK